MSEPTDKLEFAAFSEVEDHLTGRMKKIEDDRQAFSNFVCQLTGDPNPQSLQIYRIARKACLDALCEKGLIENDQQQEDKP